jgi:hypothetical protein
MEISRNGSFYSFDVGMKSIAMPESAGNEKASAVIVGYMKAAARESISPFVFE